MNIELFDPKTQGRFRELAKLVQEARELGVNHGTALADAIRDLKRLNARAATPDGWEVISVSRDRGSPIEFTGRLLAEAEFVRQGVDPMRHAFEVYETKAGALVAVWESEPAERGGYVRASALVVEPQEDAQAMHHAVMDFFDWDDRARGMAKKLGWDLRELIP